MKRFRIENQDYGTSIFTRSLPEAQQYLRAHPDEVVKVWHGDLLLAETPASVEARERAAAIVTVNNAKEAMIDKEAIINLAYRLRREIGHNACLPPQERHREAVATARSRRYWPITSLELRQAPHWRLWCLPIYHHQGPATYSLEAS